MNRLRIIYLILLVPVSLTLGASVLIPMVYPEGMLSDLDGIVGAVDHASLWTSMDPFSRALYCVGDSTCHQMSERTFILNENQMPFCIREISLIVGLFIGILALVSRPEFLPSRKMIGRCDDSPFPGPVGRLSWHRHRLDGPDFSRVCNFWDWILRLLERVDPILI